MKKPGRLHLNLYQKFVMVIILGGIIPMLLLSTFILNRMFKDYEASLLNNYEQSLDYVAGSVTNMTSGYDEVLKLLYYYMEGKNTVYNINYDNIYTIKSILDIEANGEMTEVQASRLRNEGMVTFVRYIALTDPYISSAFFLDSKERVYGYSNNSYFEDLSKLQEAIDFGNIDKTSKNMQLFPTHRNNYFKNKNSLVFSFSRNYFDLAGVVGKYKYLGTLFIEIDIASLESLFSNMQIYKEGEVYVVDEEGICVYSNRVEDIGNVKALSKYENGDSKGEELFTERILENGWRIVYKISYTKVFSQLKQGQNLMLTILGGSVIALVLSSVFFSRQMTKPIRTMMMHMEKMESGHFDIQMPVHRKDELGVLSERFNQMAKELNSYINKYYVAQIRQNEAELTALKSQIYPHFLYNTLEVIRMTAVANKDLIVSDMIEALADQIHYIIGSTSDLVRLEKELDIIKKYIFLLNCRINGTVILTTKLNDLSGFMVPQLILQPLVENAFVHGIKPKAGSGNVEITAECIEDRVEITVMDNGVGMSQEQVISVMELINSEASGIRSEDTWHSIGLKNVHDRLRHLYGEAYGVEITSSEGIGTLIKIVMPFIESQVNSDA